MKITRKLLTGAAALSVGLLALTACSGGGGGSAEGGGGGGGTGDAPSWCGPDQASVVFLDGYIVNGWRKIAAETGKIESEKCPSVTSWETIDGQGDTQKAISDINGAVATGANAIIVHTASGEAVLPALRSAHQAGVVTVPYRDGVGGTDGKDYDIWIGSDYVNDGETFGNWIKQQFPDGAKILFMSGPAGTTQGLDEKKGLDKVLGNDSKYEFIGEQPFEITDWDPAKTQQVLTAAIAKHPQIDVIVSDYGPSLVGALPEFKKAGRSIPALAASDGNVLGCFWTNNHESNPDFKMMTIKTGTDNIALAVQHAVARATGGEVPKETSYQSGIFEDSTSDDKPVQCKPDLPDDIYLSSAALDGEQQAKIIGR